MAENQVINVDLNFRSNADAVTQRVVSEMNRTAIETAKATRATDQLALANLRVANGMPPVIRAQNQLKTATQGTGVSFGTAAIQANDFAVQLAAGGSPLTAAIQQLSQLSSQAQLAGKSASGLTRVLGSPWTIAILSAIAVATSFKEELAALVGWQDKLNGSSKQYTVVSKQQELATKSLAEVTDELNTLSGRFNVTQEVSIQLAAQAASVKYNEARQTLNLAKAELKRFEILEAGYGMVAKFAPSLAPGALLLQGAAILDANRYRAQVADLENQLGNTRDAVFSAIGKRFNPPAPKTDKRSSSSSSASNKEEEKELTVLEQLNKDITEAVKERTAAEERLTLIKQKQLEAVGKEAAYLMEERRRLDKDFVEAEKRGLETLARLAERARKAREEAIQLEADRAKLAADYERGGRGGTEAAKLKDDIAEMEVILGRIAINNPAFVTLQKQIQAARLELEKLNMTGLQSQLFDVAIRGINQLGDSISQAIEGTKSWGDAFKDVAKTIIAELTKIYVKLLLVNAIKAAGGPDLGSLFGFAKGAAFANGQVIKAYANGGVVNAPTLFPMRNGLGLMGEAGAEAIMPLRRGRSGKLGVEATTAIAQPVIHVHNNVGAQVRTEVDRNGEMQIYIDAARRAIAGDIARGGTLVSRSVEGTYGMSRAKR